MTWRYDTKANKLRGKLVCVIGNDGTGKTTVTKRITRSHSESHGLLFQYVWFKSARQIRASKLYRQNFGMNKQRLSTETSRGPPGSSSGTTTVRRVAYDALVWIDYFFLGICLEKQLARGSNFICDRYYHDVVVDLCAERGSTPSEFNKYLQRVGSFFPDPDVVLLIDAPLSLALARKNDIGSEEDFERRRTVYGYLKNNPAIWVIDGSLPPDVVLARVRERIELLTRDPLIEGES